jgi:hypothetical protein
LLEHTSWAIHTDYLKAELSESYVMPFIEGEMLRHRSAVWMCRLPRGNS